MSKGRGSSVNQSKGCPMSHVIPLNGSQLFAAATAIGAVAFLAVPAPARADPLAPLPLAPACDSFGFTGAEALSQDNGWAVQFTSSGPNATGPATASSDTGTQMHGTLSGGINGRAVDFTINWDGGAKGRYVGHVNEDGSWTGTTGDSGWKGLGPLMCLTPNNPLPPAPAPEPEQIPNRPGVLEPQQAPPPLATVTADNDVYDVPNVPPGKGKKIGVLQAGRQVQVIGSCSADDWNNVVVPDMPGGKGSAWGFISCP
jgi:hypothetical protein